MAKLRARGHSDEAIQLCLVSLAEEGLQSDERFTESFITARSGRGYGIARIRMELRERGIEDALINRHLDLMEEDWRARAERERCKKFGAGLPSDPKERARQARFLHYRGFTSDQIRSVLNNDED